MTIDKKVGLFISTLILVFGSILGLYSIRTNNELMSQEGDEWATIFINTLAANLEYPVLIQDQEAISRLVKAAMAQKDIVFCQIEGRNGALLHQEGRRESGPVRKYAAPIVTTHAKDAEALLLGGLQDKTEEIGKVFVTRSLLQHNQKISDIKRTVTAFIIVAVIIGGVIAKILGLP